MFQVRIMISRMKLRFSNLSRKIKTVLFLLPMFIFCLILFLTPAGQKAGYLVSGHRAVYQNLSVLLNNDPLKVHIIEVGQGDASLIQYEGLNILIDTGPPAAAMDLTGYLKALGIRRLDLLILTHPHDDHTGGAPVLLQSFRIGTLLIPHDLKNDPFSLEALQRAEQAGTEVVWSLKGLRFELERFSAECLHPELISYDDINDYSSIWSFQLGASSLLFLGDLSLEAAKGLDLGQHAFLRSGHHGSVTSTSRELLARVKPRLVAISCGRDNSFGHPSKEVLQLLDDLDIPFLRTDESGTSVISTDGRTLRRVH